MNFYDFLTILRMRRKIILFTLFCVILITLVISLMLPKTYKATATMVLSYKGTDPVTGLTLPAQLVPGYMSTQVDIITSPNVVYRAIDRLKWLSDPQKKIVFEKTSDSKQSSDDVRETLASTLVKNVEIIPGKESSILSIAYTDKNPREAAAIANAFIAAYQDISLQIKFEPSRQASTYLREQIKLLYDNFKEAQIRLSQYQQAKGIVNVDGKIDVETNKLNDLSTQLVTAQSQSMEASSRKRNGSTDSPDVLANPVIQKIKEDLATAEAKLSESSKKYGENHPDYIGAKAEVEHLREALDAQVHSTLNSLNSNARMVQQREGALRSAVAAQKNRVMALNKARDEQISLLTKDVESAQHAYENAITRFNQTSLESQSNQSDVVMVSQARIPSAPTSPKITQNMILSVIFGLTLGIGLAMLTELMDRPLRSDEDLINTLKVPVLGTIKMTSVTSTAVKKSFASRYLRSN